MKQKYEIVLLDIYGFDDAEMPVITHHIPIGSFRVECETNIEAELLYILANPVNKYNTLWQMLKGRPDQNYMLVVAKQLPAGVYAYQGYSIISKKKDAIFWDTKYLNIGHLNAYNIGIRDPIEEVRRGNWSKVPGGEDLKKAWKEWGGIKVDINKLRKLQEEIDSGSNPSSVIDRLKSINT